MDLENLMQITLDMTLKAGTLIGLARYTTEPKFTRSGALFTQYIET